MVSENFFNESLGIGLVTKKTKNHFQWVGGEVDPDNHVEPDEVELTRLREREAELTQAIEQQETQLKYLTEHNDRLGYVTCKDLRSIFRQHLVLCLKAPQDTKLQVRILFMNKISLFEPKCLIERKS